VFGSLGFGEIMVLALVAMLVVGPGRLPKFAAPAGRMLRDFRRMASQASADLKAELGPEMANVSFSKMTPQRLVRDVLLSDDEPASAPSAPVPATVPAQSAASNRSDADGAG
jgi:sec-independent protein translocase protein TatB